MNVLVTGGAGYIGSHAALRLLDLGHAVTVIDDFSRGNRGAVEVLSAGGDFTFIEADMADRAAIERALDKRRIELVMHFAALAYVGESVDVPLRYWRVNVGATVALLEAMETCRVERLVFSSSCATYGEPPPEQVPIRESCPQHPVNPYGRSKLAGEQIIHDALRAAAAHGSGLGAVILRYFNVAGCDARGRLGEDHRPETHLIPLCLEAALRQRSGVDIFGTDYPTPDGTCVRDYVHVDDLVEAHVSAMGALKPRQAPAYNIGIGRGFSVREVVDACRAVTGVDFPVTQGPRRPGDPPVLFADASRAARELRFRPRNTSLEPTIATAWAWKKAHPRGYSNLVPFRASRIGTRFIPSSSPLRFPREGKICYPAIRGAYIGASHMPRANVTHFAVLGLLAIRPQSGYDIRQFVEQAMGHFWHESYRWIYLTLAALKAQGLAGSRDEEYGERQRVVYRITPKGQRALRAWLAEPPAMTPPRDELLLKLLLARMAPPRASAAHLQRHLDELHKRQEELSEAEKAIPDLDLDAGTRQQLALTLDRSRRITAAELRWATETLKKLKAPVGRRGARKSPR